MFDYFEIYTSNKERVLNTDPVTKEYLLEVIRSQERLFAAELKAINNDSSPAKLHSFKVAMASHLGVSHGIIEAFASRKGNRK